MKGMWVVLIVSGAGVGGGGGRGWGQATLPRGGSPGAARALVGAEI